MNISVDLFSKKSNLIVYAFVSGIIVLFSTNPKKQVWANVDFAEWTINSIKVSPNDDIVAVGGGKRCLFLINAADGKTICSVDVGSSIWSVLFLSQKKIACGLYNGTVAIVDVQTQKIERILEIGERIVLALAISPVNNDILLSGDKGGVIRQTIISSKKTVMEYDHVHFDVRDLKFLSCGSKFVSGNWDGTARLFDLDRKQSIRKFKGHTQTVVSVYLIHDDELLITISRDNTMKVWDTENGVCLSTVNVESPVICSALSADEESIVVGGVYGSFDALTKVTRYPCPPRFAVSLDRKLKLAK